MDKIARSESERWETLNPSRCKLEIKVLNVTVYGESQKLKPGSTVVDLLRELQLDSRALAVEINHELKPRDVHEVTIINDGDVLEIVTLVGGG